MQEKDVNMFVILEKIMRTPIITVTRDDVSHEVTQLYNRTILPWRAVIANQSDNQLTERVQSKILQARYDMYL